LKGQERECPQKGSGGTGTTEKRKESDCTEARGGLHSEEAGRTFGGKKTIAPGKRRAAGGVAISLRKGGRRSWKMCSFVNVEPFLTLVVLSKPEKKIKLRKNSSLDLQKGTFTIKNLRLENGGGGGR